MVLVQSKTLTVKDDPPSGPTIADTVATLRAFPQVTQAALAARLRATPT